ncbi:MAG: FHA domain-containing protein [Pirellula sp.]|jgi:pSer/pThr/pTyr-binding forkhead associated (FHA) protein|nr:FHA domain-containing protein [Pirellula sp.]
MARLTLRVVQGADRGRVFSDLKPPITIGREEGNTIQLNDERISRFHCKIQEDNHHLVLTDLESTNGTRVNGQDCQLRILRYGDIIFIGRSMLLFGTHDQIAARVQDSLTSIEDQKQATHVKDGGDFEVDSDLMQSVNQLHAIHMPPELPERLSPSQAAQLAELLEYFHARIGEIVDSVQIDEKNPKIHLELTTWQHILQVYSRLAEMIRGIADPDFRLPG